MVLLIIIPIKWLFHWEYTQHFQTNPFVAPSQLCETGKKMTPTEVSIDILVDGFNDLLVSMMPIDYSL